VRRQDAQSRQAAVPTGMVRLADVPHKLEVGEPKKHPGNLRSLRWSLVLRRFERYNLT
jgi:hypothetical protein